MINLYQHAVDKWRVKEKWVVDLYSNVGDETCGVFEIPSPTDTYRMMIIASSGGGWDHISVSRRNRCPNWPEMEFVKRLFFAPDEVAMQLHVKPSDHLSMHDYCLHLWRPNDGREIPLPPAIMVAPLKDAV